MLQDCEWQLSPQLFLPTIVDPRAGSVIFEMQCAFPSPISPHPRQRSDGINLEKKKTRGKKKRKWEQKEHTTPGVRWSSPTQLLVRRFAAYVQGSGRDPQYSTSYGRMCLSTQVGSLIKPIATGGNERRTSTSSCEHRGRAAVRD